MAKAGFGAIATFQGLCALALLSSAGAAVADEGGVGFYLPGSFGSLAATPGVPGWAWATIY